MNEKLQQAISAARNGQATEAQLLLTQVLKESPNETQAWFLLSTLVESASKKKAYLGKVLALDPDHQMAQKMLARLQEPLPAEEPIELEEDEVVEAEEIAAVGTAVVSTDASDFLAQEKGDTLPEWLIEEEGLEPTSIDIVETVEETAETEAEIPDWLQDEVPETWSEEAPEIKEPDAVKQPKEKAAVQPKPTPQSAKSADTDLQKQQKFLSRILYALIIAAVIIFALMVLMAWNTFF